MCDVCLLSSHASGRHWHIPGRRQTRGGPRWPVTGSRAHCPAISGALCERSPELIRRHQSGGILAGCHTEIQWATHCSSLIAGDHLSKTPFLWGWSGGRMTRNWSPPPFSAGGSHDRGVWGSDSTVTHWVRCKLTGSMNPPQRHEGEEGKKKKRTAARGEKI